MLATNNTTTIGYKVLTEELWIIFSQKYIPTSIFIKSMDETLHRVGPLTVAVVGRSKIANLIREELSASRLDPGKPDLILQFVDQHPQFDPITKCGGNLSYNKTDIRVQESRFEYVTDGLFANRTTKISIKTSPRRPIKFPIDLLRKYRGKDFNSYIEKTKQRISSYTFLWPVLHIELLRRGAAFIHASMVDLDGQATVLAGTGGSGKTSTCFALLNKPNSSYVAEDFCIVQSDGTGWLSPRFVTIYHSDYIHGQPDIVNYIDQLDGLNSYHWTLQVRRGKNPRRKASPKKVVGYDRMSEQTVISNSNFVLRNNVSEVTVTDLSTTEFSVRASHASFRELKRFYDILSQIEATKTGEVEIPSMKELQNKTQKIYEQAFDGSATRLIEVPFDCGPEDVITEINQN